MKETIAYLLPGICGIGIGLLFAATSHGQDAEHPGRTVYEKHCASCHDNPEQNRAPAFETLKQMSAGMVTSALTSGKMKAQGDLLSLEEKSDLVGYLTAAVQSDEWITEMRCSNKGAIDFSHPKVKGFGFDLHNSRYLSAEQAGLSRGDFEDLELA